MHKKMFSDQKRVNQTLARSFNYKDYLYLADRPLNAGKRYLLAGSFCVLSVMLAWVNISKVKRSLPSKVKEKSLKSSRRIPL